MLMQQIKYFTAVVNCKDFTEAAEQCFITQSAISQQIKSLEQELGVQLIQRGKRKFCLTLEGYCVSYNRLNGKFMKHRIYSNDDAPAATASRWDWTHDEWGRAVAWEVDCVLRGK